MFQSGGEGGIRTHGTLARTTVFETAPFDRSGTSPNGFGATDPAPQPLVGDLIATPTAPQAAPQTGRKAHRKRAANGPQTGRKLDVAGT